MKVAGLVLAAGGGSRLGRPKAEIVIRGQRLVDVAIESCVRAGLSPVVVVLGAIWLTPMPVADSPEGGPAEIWLVENTEWVTGLASSLKAGLAALQADVDIQAAVVTLVDTPSVGSEHLSRIGSALRGGAAAAAATYAGTPRTPVGLTRQVWADVAATVTGDEGARRWLRAHSDLVSYVECADLGPWTDIDTPADLPH
jgi:CTP:molybdopterin cytidylyltransferase MocA